jgi:hypothetical protein
MRRTRIKKEIEICATNLLVANEITCMSTNAQEKWKN